MYAIELKGLTKKFKERVAVDNLNLTIENGEFFALLGQNGAGKTTTIKMLSCLTKPTGGDAILLGDSVLTNPDSVKQKINLSPQETAVAPNLSVLENLKLIAGIYGHSKQEVDKKAKELMEIFHLHDREKDKAKSLSGGMKRRLSIAMALISDPKILFLDEPTLGLDVRARRELWKFISSLKGKITIVLTTHYLEEAEALADKIGIMHNGKLQTLGTVPEILAQTGKENLEEAFLSLTEGDDII